LGRQRPLWVMELSTVVEGAVEGCARVQEVESSTAGLLAADLVEEGEEGREEGAMGWKPVSTQPAPNLLRQRRRRGAPVEDCRKDTMDTSAGEVRIEGGAILAQATGAHTISP